MVDHATVCGAGPADAACGEGVEMRGVDTGGTWLPRAAKPIPPILVAEKKENVH